MKAWHDLPRETQAVAIDLAAILLRIRERQLRDADKERDDAA